MKALSFFLLLAASPTAFSFSAIKGLPLDADNFPCQRSELWTSAPEAVSFRECTEPQRMFLYLSCKQRWRVGVDGAVFDVRDRGMWKHYRSAVFVKEVLGEGYYAVERFGVVIKVEYKTTELKW